MPDRFFARVRTQDLGTGFGLLVSASINLPHKEDPEGSRPFYIANEGLGFRYVYDNLYALCVAYREGEEAAEKVLMTYHRRNHNENPRPH